MSSSILLVITGASRGLGRAIAKAFDEYCPNLYIHLVARSRDGLEETRSFLTNNADRTSTYSMNLGDLDGLDENINTLLAATRPYGRYKQVIIVNNAGSLGPLGKSVDLNSLKEFRQMWDFNVTSSAWFAARWAKELQGHPLSTIVNISSLCGIQPFPTMGPYSAGKAARVMFHSVLAKECQSIQILNYAPGPLQTDMTVELRSAKELDEGILKSFQEADQRGELIDPCVSSRKLVKLVLDRDYESGKHIDFFDLP